MVAFSRFALLAVATMASAQSFGRLNGNRPSGVALPSGGHGGRGGHGHHHGSGFAHPTGSFEGPRPTGFPSGFPSGVDDNADVQDLAAHSRSGDMPPFPFPTGGFPTDFPSGIASPTGGRGHHRGGKGRHSGAAFPTGSFPAPSGRPSDIPSGLPEFTLAKRQASMTHRAPIHSRKHGKPTGIVPPAGARPTGYRPSGPHPAGPSGTPPAEIEKRQDDEESASSKPSRPKPSGARPSGAFPPMGARPTGYRPSGPHPTGAPHGMPNGPKPSGFVTSTRA